MRKHFLLLFLMALLPLAGFTAYAAEPEAVGNNVYTGQAQPLVTAGTEANYTYYYAVVADGAADPALGDYSSTDVPTRTDAGNYDVFYVKKLTEQGALTEDDLDGAHKIDASIAKKQIVYYLTGATYSVGDVPDVTRSYSLASGSSFIGDDKLEDFATFAFATSGNDALDDLDENGRFQNIRNYNITALRVIEKPVQQNYDFRFTSTAVIVVTAKSIANFVYNAVPAQTYIGSKITFEGDDIPAIYATVADRDAQTPIALDPSNYDVTFGENINVVYDNNNNVTNGGTIIYTGKGNYEGTLTIPFVIEPRELTNVTVDELDNRTYAYGAEIVPELTGNVHGTGAEPNKVYTLDPTKDFTVNYNNTNINAGNAVGTISVANGNFTFATNATVANVAFTIDPKNLADAEITVTTQNASYPYTGAQIQPNFAVTWTIDETANVITDNTAADWTANTNIAVGKGYVTVVPKAVEAPNPQNYTGSKTVAFDIIPTDLVSAGVTITLQKENPNYDPNDQNSQQWIAATYQYEGRDIKPGTPDANQELVDGRLLVKDGDLTLEEGVDYEIVSYGDDVTIGQENYDGDNENASAIAGTKGTVTIKGLGNYGAIDALSEPITLSQVFDIAKRTLTFTATPVETTFSVAPTFACTNDAVDDLGGQISYETVQVATYNGTAWGEWTAYNGALTALEVTAAEPVNGSKKYQYKPTWTATIVEPEENPDENVVYSTAEQVAARANYDIANVVYEFGAITINNATWIIVPDNASKKYMVADAALVDAGKFTYKVYNGSVDEANLVVNPEFNEGAAPVIGRALTAQGENVVNGGYVISVLNANANVAAGTYGEAQNKVAKTGYTIVCETATLTIDPFPITITANNQTILYGGEPNTDTDADSYIRTVDANGVEVEGNLLTVTFSPVMFGNQTLINRDDLNLTLTWDEDGTVSDEPHANALVPLIDNPNFAPTYVNGSLTVIAGNIMILGRTDAKCKDEIVAHNGVDNVTVKFEPRELKAETWQAMAFPFELSVAEFNKAIYDATAGKGYAVVNILNEDNTTDKPAFMLWMREIPANTPFLFKVYNGKTGDELNTFDMKDLQFADKYITYAEQAESEDAAHNKFIGIYQTTTVANKAGDPQLYWLFNHNTGKFQKYTGNSRTLNPLTGYLKTATEIDAFARITVVEEDGTVTAISTINADGEAVTADGWYTINGVKLQGMPTEKGVYIQNGKKVVLK